MTRDEPGSRPHGEVALLFSGGLDSSAAAILLARRFQVVHLLTYDNGHGMVGVGLARRPARDLARAFSGRMVHQVLSCGELFRSLLTGDLPGNQARWPHRFTWCLACKMAMHAETARYCLDRGIGSVSDGSSDETGYYVEQSPLGLQLLRSLYADLGLTFTTPIHRLSGRGEEQRLLARHGIRAGLRFRKRNPGTQPLCLPGNAIHFMSTLLSAHPSHPDEAVEDFFRAKAPACLAWARQGLPSTTSSAGASHG